MLDRVLDAANYLQIDYLKQLILASIAIDIISKDKQTLKNELGIKDNEG